MGELKPEVPNQYGIIRPYQARLNLGGITPNALNAAQIAGTESEWLDCSERYVICISPELSALNVTARLRVILRDDETGRIYSDDVFIENTGRQEGIRVATYYHGRGEHAFTFGASQYKILLVEAPSNSGFISVFTGAV